MFAREVAIHLFQEVSTLEFNMTSLKDFESGIDIRGSGERGPTTSAISGEYCYSQVGTNVQQHGAHGASKCVFGERMRTTSLMKKGRE